MNALPPASLWVTPGPLTAAGRTPVGRSAPRGVQGTPTPETFGRPSVSASAPSMPALRHSGSLAGCSHRPCASIGRPRQRSRGRRRRARASVSWHDGRPGVPKGTATQPLSEMGLGAVNPLATAPAATVGSCGPRERSANAEAVIPAPAGERPGVGRSCASHPGLTGRRW